MTTKKDISEQEVFSIFLAGRAPITFIADTDVVDGYAKHIELCRAKKKELWEPWVVKEASGKVVMMVQTQFVVAVIRGGPAGPEEEVKK